MPSSKLPPAQAAVLAHLFNATPCGDEANTFDFSLAGELGERIFAVELPLLEGLNFGGHALVSTLATHVPHVYFAITKGRALDAARILANLEDLHRSKELGEGDSVWFLEWTEHPSGYRSVVIAKPSALPGFEQLGESAELQSRHVHFWLALPCTEKDLAARKGLDAQSFIHHRVASGAPIFFE